MGIQQSSPLLRIGVFYDGSYFNKASNYYLFHHERHARLSISGLHEFIRNELAQREGIDARFCQIVDAHYFRGRLSASDARERDTLFAERVVDDILMREGVVTHYLPRQGAHEKGVDVWFALEAYELTIHKRFDVVALIAGDGDFVPLLRKLNTLGARVMLLGFDYSFTWEGEVHTSRTSARLIEESTYPVLLSSLIDDRTRRADLYINNLFAGRPEGASTVPRRSPLVHASGAATPAPAPSVPADAQSQGGTIQRLLDGYGFVQRDTGGTLFFHLSSLGGGTHFSDLHVGMRVAFREGANDRGPCAVDVLPEAVALDEHAADAR